MEDVLATWRAHRAGPDKHLLLVTCCTHPAAAAGGKEGPASSWAQQLARLPPDQRQGVAAQALVDHSLHGATHEQQGAPWDTRPARLAPHLSDVLLTPHIA